MVKSFEEVKERLLAFPVKRKIGVAAAHDEHTLDAVVMAARDGLVEPVLVGDEEAVAQMTANNRQQRRYSGLRWRLAQNNG